MSNMFRVANSRLPAAFLGPDRPAWAQARRGILSPAGQAQTVTGSFTYTMGANGTVLDTSGLVVPGAVAIAGNASAGFYPVDVNGTPIQGYPAIDANGNVTNTTPTATTNPNVATNPATYGLIASGLGTTANAITSAITSNNQVAMAQLALQNQTYIAGLQYQLQTSPNNPQLLAQMQQAQFLQQQLIAGTQNTMTIAVVIGLGIVVFGAVYYLSNVNKSARRSSTRRNPVLRYPRRRYVSSKHLRRLRGY